MLTPKEQRLNDAAEVIARNGGPAKTAKKIGAKSTQTVYNWLSRGIPHRAILEHPECLRPTYGGSRGKK